MGPISADDLVVLTKVTITSKMRISGTVSEDHKTCHKAICCHCWWFQKLINNVSHRGDYVAVS